VKLMTKAVEKSLPKLYATEGVLMGDKIAKVKYFDPMTQWTWYGIEYDGKDEFFGYVCGFENELGYFYLSELKSIKCPWGLSIERDIYFKPTKVAELSRLHSQRQC
jgi:hypothetical protein